MTIDRIRIKAGFFAGSCVAAFAAGAGANAQSVATQSFEQKPPPGYERRALHVGSVTVMPEVRLSTILDSNVFATSTNEDEDILFLVEPKVMFDRTTQALKLSGEAHATVRQYAENTGENINLYGANARARYQATPSQTLSAGLGFERTFQRRDDPERNDDLNLPLTPIANFSAEAGYGYRPGRIGLDARLGLLKTDYDEPVDDERDLSSYRGSLRALAGVSSKVDVFAEVYGVLRDFRLPLDLSGVDRDGETFGANTGLSLDFTDKLEGEVGVGIFRATFDDPALQEFTGLGLSGALRWYPRQRTAFVIDAFRGDVATNRSGASGRVDTRASVKLFQEVRHNLRARLEAGYRHGEFRSGSGQTQDDLSAGAAIEYMLNRHIGAEIAYTFRKRDATAALDEFTSHQLGFALIARF
ncbi:MAG: outer membrane beta-barrel protein [Parvularculaceae bacterium]